MPYQPPTLVTPEVIGKDNYTELCKFIREKVDHLDRRLSSFRTEKLPEYVRLYKARPKNESVSWPWPGAANLVIPIIGTYSDELLARIMGGIWMYEPLWTATLSGDTSSKDGEDLKAVTQEFLSDMAYDPKELELYRAEQSFFHSTIKYGTGVIYTPYEYAQQIERVYQSGGLNDNDPVVSANRTFTKIDGPHPELLPLNRFIFDPSVPKLENMKLMGHIESLDYWGVRDLPSKSPYYTETDILNLCKTPDAIQETEMEQEVTRAFSIDSVGVQTGAARWYIYHLWFTFTLQGKEYAFQARYHKHGMASASQGASGEGQVLWIAFNNYPRNMLPYQDAKLAYDDECYLGTGFAEMLHIAQKEISNNNNWRTNNRNYAMLGAWRIDPESKLGSILDIFPGVGIPAREGEVEYIKTGADLGYSDGPDQFHMAIAKERCGVDPAIGGTGGGIVNPKRGIYSAAGTSMVMMQQNNRNNLRTGDMRFAHVKLGLKFLTMYANFGIGEKLKKYGSKADLLKKALDLYRNEMLGLRIKPTSASLNKELERQNDMILSQHLNEFYTQEAQIIQAINTPNIPPTLQQYYMDTLVAARALMTGLLRNFNKDNVDVLVPDVTPVITAAKQQQQAALQAAQQQQAGGAGNENRTSQGSPSIPQVPTGIMGGGGVPTSSEIM